MSEQKSYLQIFTSTVVFGFVQVYNIIIGIIKSKFVAIWLGPSGMGVMGLYISVISMISSFTNLGLGQSAVRSISEASGEENKAKISSVVIVLQKLVWITGLLGSCVMIILSTPLSRWTFGTDDYKTGIIWLSVSVFLQAVSSGQFALLQGLRKVRFLASANLTGATLGLFASVPLYYFLGEKGIVPSIVATSVVTLLRSWYFSKKVKLIRIKPKTDFFFKEGKMMLNLGIILSLSSMLAILSGYLVRIFIQNRGGLNEVGLFQAGWAIINGYIGMIFTAMSMDYYPRLSAVNKNNPEIEKLVNQQTTVAILILAPLLAIFLIFNDTVIILLYSDKFLAIKYFLLFGMLGMLFKSINWAMSYIFLAKNDSKTYFFIELLTNFFMCVFYILGYYIHGLAGMGIAIIAGNLIRIFMMYPLLYRRYSFKFSRDFYFHITVTTLLLLTCYLIIEFSGEIWKHLLGGSVILIISVYSIFQLEKKMNLSVIVRKRLRL